jgi:hypothetical protein
MNLPNILKSVRLSLLFFFLFGFSAWGQNLSGFQTPESEHTGKNTIEKRIQFNGYTNHWHDDYTQWHRYGNLFKIALPDLQPTILQSKVDIAEDLGLPGLVMQEGFLSQLFSTTYKTIENPELNELEKTLTEGNTLVVTNPETKVGRELENRAKAVFEWADNLPSHQFSALGLERIKLFYLVHNDKYLFVISSSSQTQINRIQTLLANTNNLLSKYNLHKGWFGVSTLLKSVTCAPGHPLELIGIGMNEGNSWFIFDGYMDFLAKQELENWVSELNLPVVADVGFSPVYGCSDYDGLQVQDMATKQAWIDYASKKGGYAFRPVYDPESDNFQFDGYIAHEGNKEQIDHEDVPFINKTGMLNENLTSSMVLFIEKEKPLTNESIWEAIMNRKEVAVLEQAKMMGPAEYRNVLQILYLDKVYLENYFGDNLDIEAEVEGYDLIVTLKNYFPNDVSGFLEIITNNAIDADEALVENVILAENETKQIRIPLTPLKESMGRTNPVAVNFLWDNKKKSTVAMLDLPPAISIHQLLYAHAPEVRFPVTIHNFTTESSFPVKIEVFEKDHPKKEVLSLTEQCKTATASFNEMDFSLQLEPGNYIVKVNALGTTSEGQLGVGKAEGRPYVYEVDLNSDGINEYRMENDSVQVTLLRTGARVIEYIVKSKNDNVLFKVWPEKAENHNSPYRMNRFYPYGGFEDFLGQASMETHRVYDARIVQKEGDFVQVEMETDYFGNHLKKIFTLYGNSPLLEVRFELNFKNREANVLGPQPILELGKNHGTEDVFTVPAMEGLKEYRMRPEEYYGQAIDVMEGWNAGYDTMEDISFVGAFPVSQPHFLHMWMNHPRNTDAPHYYVEFQPWIPIIQKSKMYFSYYLWGSAGTWQNGVNELRKRNLITKRNNN